MSDSRVAGARAATGDGMINLVVPGRPTGSSASGRPPPQDTTTKTRTGGLLMIKHHLPSPVCSSVPLPSPVVALGVISGFPVVVLLLLVVVAWWLVVAGLPGGLLLCLLQCRVLL